MLRSAQSHRFWRFSSRLAMFGALVLAFAFASGCGEEDPCATKTCNFGVCDSSNGDCVNKESCRVDEECVPGFVCGQGNTCVAQNQCSSDADCQAGVCEEGACVNPPSCEEDSECLQRTYCGQDGTCVPDPCNEVSCNRGVCQRGTDNCVAADSCTKRTEQLDCLSGQKCLENSCVDRENYCDQLTCDRGVCSYQQEGCVNADDCEGDRANCREGFFCNQMDRCQRDRCVQGNVDCEDGGVCDPTTGLCTNAGSCEENADCTSEYLCINGSCTPEGSACGDASGDGGCPGNQVCAYDDANNTASCTEPEVCETSIDCLADRACGGRTCLSSTECKSDVYEPNNMMGEATNVFGVAPNGYLSGTLCQQDTDMYTFTTTDVVENTFSGELFIKVTIPDADIGLGEATMTLTGPEGSELGSASLGAMGQDGSMSVTTNLGVPDHGTYSLAINTGDSMSINGLSYDLNVSIQPTDATAACSDPDTIVPGQRVSGDASTTSDTGLGSSCTTGDDSAKDVVYELRVDRPQEVTIRAIPSLSSQNMTVALRDRCREAPTERACADNQGEGGSETITRVLAEGSYYIVLQAAEGGELGPYDLVVDQNYLTTCGSGSNYCIDGSTAAICGRTGGRFNELTCDEGCHTSTGECYPPDGDVCATAPTIADQMSTQTRQIDLRQYNNDYTIAPGGCLDENPRTGGPDRAYNVTVPSGKVFTVRSSFANGVQGSLYFVDDCTDVDGTCTKGAQGDDDSPSEEELFFRNTTDSEVTKTFIVDTAADQAFSTAQLEFLFEEIVCSPAATQCNQSGNVDICNSKGTAFSGTETCTAFECQNGYCPGDSCSTPYNITQAASQSGGLSMTGIGWSNFTSQISGDDTCGGAENIDNVDTEGVDVVYQIDLGANEYFSATVSNIDPQQASLYLKSSLDCGTTNTTCLDAIEEEGDDVSVSYATQNPKTLYMIADTEDDTGGTFDLSANIQSTTCPPAGSSCSGGDVQTCAADGLSQGSTYSCSSGCTGGFCNTRDSEYCWDAENITSQLKSTNGLDRQINWSNFNNDIEEDIPCGDVDDFDSDGEDAVYVVDLQANEKLTINLNVQGSSADASPYIIRTCEDAAGTCLAGDDSSGDSTVTYTAASPETVFVVADHDDGFSTPSDFQITGNIQ